ncbi:heavy-metal-associated domain-containing protein [Aquicoccus porphyridii]|uniref:Heavy-metal-associated domain-containing protein n=1 Tax=Aquicoccus porphyridii TaxID=1852029 RepID=A0A5A9YYV0_9RHOB|nr:heavy-metal-associated domain-containing protein [Aquicoccus porphyridii]KAA0910113.1 heavy-metal-associated domain-containing protein [Aquicoccus porphyridii]RAI53439.1 copper chaperone [Rhodobacteraceae bacterium AsT-22]
MMTFSVPKMSCGHCTASIEGKILDVDEGADVQCDLAERRVVVESVLDAAAIMAAIEAAGFEASPV